ncbi:carbon catabolite repressor protein 4 homolog 2-like [Papaver somniferum]|uniref:carbon catabolite repressor protein 4 homolog 2-like n=1 Tax=Papaver somniferum TaxID=3469 RepID=UPI000E6FEEBA|nr:carbon catabolite repressor protein 4 homolog 2-like [Papaver somniferum]
MQAELNLETPSVGCEIIPIVSLHSKEGSKVIPDDKLKFNWYRLQNQERPICCVHPTQIAAFQCRDCSVLEKHVKESFHCSLKCYHDQWLNHRKHHIAAPSQTTADVVDDESCCDCSYCSAFDKDSLVNKNAEIVHGSWVKVGSSKTYLPTIKDFGYRLKLEAVATFFSEGKPRVQTEVKTNHVIIPPPRRCMIPVTPLDGFSNFKLESKICSARSFGVLSYNILADLCANPSRYSYCPASTLNWEYRSQNLLREIIRYDADVICLQEVQHDHFEEFFMPKLKEIGYSGIHKSKTSALFTSKYVFEGCATFFRLSKFRLIKKYELEFKNTAQKIAWSLDAEKRRSMMKDNIALTVILEAIKAEPVSDTLNHRICVANVHVSADPENTDVKLWQVGTLIEDLERSVAHSNIPVLICADLNSLPKSAAHTLVVNGSVDLKHEELVNTPDGIIEHLKLSHKLLPLASAYSSFSRTKKGDMMDSDTKEPRFTTATLYFRNTIDYIFYSGVC